MTDYPKSPAGENETLNLFPGPHFLFKSDYHVSPCILGFIERHVCILYGLPETLCVDGEFAYAYSDSLLDRDS
jgi:hypothetical protein